MLTTFRKFQKGALIVVTIIIVIAFAFLYSDFDFAKGTLGSSDCIIKVSKRCYRVEEAHKLARFQGLAYNLGMGQFANTLRGQDRMDMDPTEFVMNLLVLRKQAEKLGIEPSAQEITDETPKLPIFTQPWVNGQMIRNMLGRNGLDEGDLAQLVKDYLSFTKLQNLIGAGIQAVPTNIEKAYILENQRYTASLVKFDRSDFLDKAQITDEEVKKFYDDRNVPPVQPAASNLDFAENPDAGEPVAPVQEPKDKLLTEEERGFDFVKFIPEKLPEDATREQSAKSSVTFATEVNKIYAELADEDADFVKVANDFAKKKNPFKMEVGKFAPFKQLDAPDAINENGGLLTDLFSETLEKEEVTVPHDGPDGSYYVFRFSDLVAPRPMTLEEAKEGIVTALKIKKSNQLASDAANAALAKIKTAIDGGKSILDAASANNFDLVTLPNFSSAEPPKLTDPEKLPDPGLIISSVRKVGPGELSQVVERKDGKGYFITYVEKVEIYKDEEKDNKRMLVADAELDEKSKMFRGWLKQRANEAGAERLDSILNYRPQ